MSSAPIVPTVRIHVLAIDGGGVRGIIPAEILAHISSRTRQPIHTLFDLIAGTSTGGVTALGLATAGKAGEGPYTPRELSDFYMNYGPQIYWKRSFAGVRQWFRPKYSPKPLERALAQLFGETMLSSALTPLLISSYDLAAQRPFFFKSHQIGQNGCFDLPVTTVARATCATPTYFPPLQLEVGNREVCLADGGVFGNNPAMAAYAEARMLYGRRAPAEVLVISVGSGDRRDNLKYRRAGKWGLLKWAKLIAPVFMDGISEAVDYELQWIDRACFCRFQYEHLAVSSGDMDKATAANLRSLKRQAAECIEENLTELNAVCAELVKEHATGPSRRATPQDGADLSPDLLRHKQSA